MKSFYRSSIQLGFSNLKKVRLELSVHTHSISSSSELFRAKMTQIPIEFQLPLFLGFKFDLKISSNEHPCLNPPPRGFDLISLQESFWRYAPVNSKRDLPPACGRANPQGLFWWANSSPQGKKKVQNLDLKSVLKPQTQDIFLKYSLGMPNGHAWKFTKFWEFATGKSERLLVKV